MGKADVIQAIFDSYGLFKEHYREVAIPLIFMLIVSGLGHIGGSGGSRSYSGSWPDSGESSPSMIANAIGAPDIWGSIGLALLAIILAVLVIALALYILNIAVQFYVFEHFYAILLKKKISDGWQGRMARHTAKALVLQLFWLAITAALFALPLLQAWNAVPQIADALKAKSGAALFSGLVSALSGVLLLFVAALLAMLAAGFLLSPLWVYYVMDGRGLFESVGSAVSLVAAHPLEFLAVGLIFGLLGIAGWGAALLFCCFAWIISPIIDVFLIVLYGLTLMKIKLALETR